MNQSICCKEVQLRIVFAMAFALVRSALGAIKEKGLKGAFRAAKEEGYLYVVWVSLSVPVMSNCMSSLIRFRNFDLEQNLELQQPLCYQFSYGSNILSLIFTCNATLLRSTD